MDATQTLGNGLKLLGSDPQIPGVRLILFGHQLFGTLARPNCQLVRCLPRIGNGPFQADPIDFEIGHKFGMVATLSVLGLTG